MGGMFHVKFDDTAVCGSQQRLVQFQNTGDQPIVIASAAITSGSDILGNFIFNSVKVGTSAEKPSVGGVIENINVPSGETYSFSVDYGPKLERSQDSAILDLAYESPKEGIIQIVLEGNSSGNVCPPTERNPPVDSDCSPACGSGLVCQNGTCVSTGTDRCMATSCPSGQQCNTTSGRCEPVSVQCTPACRLGEVWENGTCRSGGEADEERVRLTVELVAAVTSAVGAPIDSTQGIAPGFIPVDLPLILMKGQRKVKLLAYTQSGFILPQPKPDTPTIGHLIKGPTRITIPNEVVGSYDPSTGSLDILDVTVRLEGDFKATLKLRLTTDQVSIRTDPPLNTSALRNLGSLLRSHYNSVAKQISGTPIANKDSGKVFLAGVAPLEDVDTTSNPNIDATLKAGLEVPTSMAILMEGTIKKVVAAP